MELWVYRGAKGNTFALGESQEEVSKRTSLRMEPVTGEDILNALGIKSHEIALDYILFSKWGG